MSSHDRCPQCGDPTNGAYRCPRCTRAAEVLAPKSLRFDTEPAWAEVEREIEHKHDVVGAILNPQSRLIKEAAREAFEPLAGRPSRPMPLALLVTSGLAPFLALMIIATTGIRLFPVVLLIRWLGTFAFVTGLILIVRNRRADARARRPHGEQVTPLQ